MDPLPPDGVRAHLLDHLEVTGESFAHVTPREHAGDLIAQLNDRRTELLFCDLDDALRCRADLVILDGRCHDVFRSLVGATISIV